MAVKPNLMYAASYFLSLLACSESPPLPPFAGVFVFFIAKLPSVFGQARLAGGATPFVKWSNLARQTDKAMNSVFTFLIFCQILYGPPNAPGVTPASRCPHFENLCLRLVTKKVELHCTQSPWLFDIVSLKTHEHTRHFFLFLNIL